MRIFKVEPFFSEKIWGGTDLQKFGFNLKHKQQIGEAWIISAHENGMGIIHDQNVAVNPLSFKKLFNQNRKWFGNYQGNYPLLVKILTPKTDLSVQVHPDDQYAKKQNSFGKPEAWYILDCPENSEIIYGHNAHNKKELKELVATNNWNTFLKKIKVKPGDFFYVAPGKVHALTSGVIAYEIQRSSDITYRFYDYDRTDQYGQKRQLDLVDAINCTAVPDIADYIVNNAKMKIFSSNYFSLYLFDATKEQIYRCDEATNWLQLSVIEGTGTINDIKFKQAESAIACDNLEPLNITGNLRILISWIKK